MKKIKNKVFKGMTLYEIMIAIAILAVLTLILVTVASAINGYLGAANDVNDRVAEQAPVAEAKLNGKAHEVGDVEIFISVTSNGAANLNLSLSGKMHAVYDEEDMTEHEDEAGGGLNMKFIDEFEFPSESATKTTNPAAGAMDNE